MRDYIVSFNNLDKTKFQISKNNKMKKIILLILAFAVFPIANAQDWQTSITFTPGQTISDIYRFDENTIYAVSSLYNGSGLNIKKTIDNGTTWTEQNTNTTEASFRAIGSNGTSVFMVGNDGKLITNNGTDTWSTIPLGISTPLRDIYFVNENVGFLTSDDAIIFKTTDGGTTWANLNPTISGVGTIANIYFLNENKGFVCGFNYLQLSEDGGQTWEYVDGFTPSQGNFQLNAIQFLDDNVGYICGDVGLMYRTDDGGATWALQTTNTTESLQDLKFISENIGFACGFGGTILRTEDGGSTWTPMTASISENFRAIDFNGNKGFMTSQFGSILSYAEPLSVSEFSNNAFLLYPNPASQSINFQVNKNINVAYFEIIDLQGRIFQKGSEIKNGLNISDLGSGVYIINLKTVENENFTKLFIKK